MIARQQQVLLVTLMLVANAAFPAAVQGPPSAEAISKLEAAITAQAAQLEAQRQQLEAQRAQLEALRAALEAKPAAGAAEADAVDQLRQEVREQQLVQQDSPRWTFVAGRPTITSADGRSNLSLRLLTQLDAAWYDQDPQGPLTTDYRRGSAGATNNRETTAASDLSSGTNFRRARFGVEGTFARDFAYRFIGEFGGSGTEGPTRINDAWVSYSGFAPLTIQVGAFSPPANMDDGTSPEDSLFIERATPAELSRSLAGADGRVGVGVRGSGARWMSAVTLTGGTTGDAEAYDEQLGIVGRVGALALTSPDYNVHVGLSGTYVFRAADQGDAASGGPYTIRFRDRPELRVDGTRLIDTGPIAASGAYAAGVELGANWRNFLFQGENFWYGIGRRNSTLPDPTFGGYYLEGSWVLTGEPHRYNMANGSFQAPRPLVPFSASGGPGAWELALRYSSTDLNDAEGAPDTPAVASTVRGGKQDILSIGVNWYVNSNLRFLLDYMNVDADRLNPATATSLPFGPAPATPPVGVDIGQRLSIYALRTQFSF